MSESEDCILDDVLQLENLDSDYDYDYASDRPVLPVTCCRLALITCACMTVSSYVCLCAETGPGDLPCVLLSGCAVFFFVFVAEK